MNFAKWANAYQTQTSGKKLIMFYLELDWSLLPSPRPESAVIKAEFG